MTKQELLASFEERIEKRIALRLALDDGELIFTATKIYFIAIRLGQWAIVEDWERDSISRWALQESFMGPQVAIFTPEGRFVFRKFPPELVWENLFTSAPQYGKRKLKNVEKQEFQVSQEETSSGEPYSYQESAQEMMDMLSKHVSQANPDQPLDLKDLIKQKKRKQQRKQKTPKIEHKPKEKRNLALEIPLPNQKKKGGCGGCFKVIFWFVFISIFFSGFLTSILNSL